MTTGVTRTIFDTWINGDQVAIAFVVYQDKPERKATARIVKDMSRAAAFMENNADDLRDVAQEYIDELVPMTFEDFTAHQSHYMSSIVLGDSCPYHHPDLDLEEFADWISEHHILEPGYITERLRRQREQLA